MRKDRKAWKNKGVQAGCRHDGHPCRLTGFEALTLIRVFEPAAGSYVSAMAGGMVKEAILSGAKSFIVKLTWKNTLLDAAEGGVQG
jgi:hypothetical protein